ncbi:MAG: hypothetical protein WDW38_008293 [Sanguina aurantia]
MQFDMAQNAAVQAHLQQQHQRMLATGGQAAMQGQAARMVGYNGLGAPDGGMGGPPGGPVPPPTTKESRTRLADGRFRSDEQHQRKMTDMTKKCNELFDGGIQNEFEILDHRKIKCRVCAHVAATYSPYHTDCVRKHFLRHHEQMLMERGIDLSKWRKEYEAGATGRQRHRADSTGVRGVHGSQVHMQSQMQGMDPSMHSMAAVTQQQQQQQQQALLNHFAATGGVPGGMGSTAGVEDGGMAALMAAPSLMSNGTDAHGRPLMPFDLASLGLHMDPNSLGMGLPAALLASLQQQQQQQGMTSLEQAGQIMLAAVAAAAAQSQQATALRSRPLSGLPLRSPQAAPLLSTRHPLPWTSNTWRTGGGLPTTWRPLLPHTHVAMREQGLDDGSGQQPTQQQVDQQQQELLQQQVELQHHQQQAELQHHQQQAELLQQQQMELMQQHANLQQQQQQHHHHQHQQQAAEMAAAAAAERSRVRWRVGRGGCCSTYSSSSSNSTTTTSNWARNTQNTMMGTWDSTNTTNWVTRMGGRWGAATKGTCCSISSTSSRKCLAWLRCPWVLLGRCRV